MLNLLQIPIPNQSASAIDAVEALSKSSAQSWDKVWQVSVHGPVFAAISRSALALAGLLVAVFVIGLAKEWLEDNSFRPINPARAIPVVLVVILLVPNGNGAAFVCDVVRAISNSTNTGLITVLNTDLKVEDQLNVLRQYSRARGQIYELSKQCDNKVRNDERTACLQEVRKQIGNVVSSVDLGDQSSWLESLQNLASRVIQDPGEIINAATGAVKDAVLSAIEQPLLWISQLVLLASQVAFGIIGEIAFTLTACMAPLAIVGLLLPNGIRTFQTWISGFFGIGLFKFALNIITGLAATYSYYGGATDLLPLSIVLGLLGPILAVLIAAGGGVAIYNGFAAIAGTLVSIGAALL